MLLGGYYFYVGIECYNIFDVLNIGLKWNLLD